MAIRRRKSLGCSLEKLQINGSCSQVANDFFFLQIIIRLGARVRREFEHSQRREKDKIGEEGEMIL